MVYSISEKNIGKLLLDSNGKTFYGAYQEWYPTLFRRMTGCGPTAAANLLACALPDVPFGTAEARVAVMQTMWNYLTPGVRGLHRVRKFKKGSDAFFKAKKLSLSCRCAEFAADSPLTIGQTADFIKEALSLDAPLAFLNLLNNSVKDLERWHWVTIVSFDDADMTATVFDGDKKFLLPLPLWFEKPRDRCGLAYYAK